MNLGETREEKIEKIKKEIEEIMKGKKEYVAFECYSPENDEKIYWVIWEIKGFSVEGYFYIRVISPFSPEFQKPRRMISFKGTNWLKLKKRQRYYFFKVKI